MPEIKDYPLLLRLSGEDPQIIMRADARVRQRFAGIGRAVLLIALCSLSAAAIFFCSLFDGSWWPPAFMSVLWGVIILNLYLLLLSSVSPASFRSRDIHGKKRIIIQDRSKIAIRLSLMLRIVFMGFLGLLSGQPIHLAVVSLLEKDKMNAYVDAKKAYLNARYESIRLAGIAKEEKNIAREVVQGENISYFYKPDNAGLGQQMTNTAKEDSLLAVAFSKVIAATGQSPAGMLRQLPRLQNLLIIADSLEGQAKGISESNVANTPVRDQTKRWQALTDSRISDKEEWDTILTKDNFLLYRIEASMKHFQLSWFISIAVILLFILPIRWKYEIRNKTKFYTLKEQIERRFIQDSYAAFKHWYSAVFLKKYEISVSFFESCTDAPFNLDKATKAQQGRDQEALLEKLYSDKEFGEANKELVGEKTVIV